MKLKINFIVLVLLTFLSNKLVGQVIGGEINPCPGVNYTYTFTGPSFTNYFQWYATDGTIISQNSSTVVVRWDNVINNGGTWNLRVHYEAMGSGGTSGGSTYLDLKVKPKVTSLYNISGETEIPGNFVGNKTYTASPLHSTYPATSFLWTTNTGVQITTTSPSVSLDMSDKQLRWIGVSGKNSACSSWGPMSQLNIAFTSIINGPSQICSEGTYSIINPGTISLENAAGIATLTTLGNNQWKVTRVGTNSGAIKLRSMLNGRYYDKDIEIGTIAKGSISGNAVLQLGESQTYTLALNGNTDYNWSISYNPNVTWTKLSPTSIKLSTTGSVPMGWSENITISAQAVSSCGLSSNYITKTIKFVNERDPRIED